MVANTIVTVSQLNRFVKSLLEEQKPLTDLLVRGEITNLSYRSSSGHLYFTLGDGDSSIRAVMFSRYACKLASFPDEGSLVVVRGSASLYERDGSFQLVAYDLQELGTGGGQQSLELVKKKLQDEGLFATSRKRAFPSFPRVVAVVTSPEGAALQDIIATFNSLNPLVKLRIYPATVQGAGAAASVIAALAAVVADGDCQSCVIARGGGSSEDLSAFNDEALVRAVAACPVPVVSAVGHEVDYSLTDLVADARAATPTAACRLLAEPISRITDRIVASREALASVERRRLEQLSRQVERLTLTLSARSPEGALKKNRQKLIFLVKSIDMEQSLIHERLRRRTLGLVDRLELVNPAQLLRRGYSITSGSRGVVSTCAQAAVGDTIVTQLVDGRLTATITSVEEDSSR